MQGDCGILFSYVPENTITYEGFLINPTYADDITFAGTNKQQIDEIEEKMTKQLDRYNLKINQVRLKNTTFPDQNHHQQQQPYKNYCNTKITEWNWSGLDWLLIYKPPIPENKSTNWTKCKLLGSLLETTNDIDRRKILTIESTKTFEHTYKSKRINTDLKIRTFNYTASIFLYNSELWTLIETLQNTIDAFHRKLLRRVINIQWPKTISNEPLYEKVKIEK